MLFLTATTKTYSRKESYVLEVTRIAGLLDGYGETRLFHSEGVTTFCNIPLQRTM